MVICEWEKDVAGFGGCLGIFVVVFCSLSLYIPRLLVIFLDMCLKIQGEFCSGVLNRKKMMFYWKFLLLGFFFFFFACMSSFLAGTSIIVLSQKQKQTKNHFVISAVSTFFGTWMTRISLISTINIMLI